MKYDNLIAELGKMIGLESLKLTEDEGSSVFFDEDEIIFEYTEGRLLLIAPLGPVEGNEKLYRDILEANFVGRDSALGSIGINPLYDEYTLSRTFEGDLEYKEFELSLLFIRTLRKWKSILQDGQVPEKFEETPTKVEAIVFPD